MKILEFYRVLTPIIGKLGCGHTWIAFSKEDEKIYFKENANHLPLDVKIVDDRLYVIKSFFDTNISAGSEIISINNYKADEITDTLLRNIGSDGNNEAGKYYVMNRWFNRVYFDYIEAPEQYNIKYRQHDNGKVHKTTVKSRSRAEYDSAVYKTCSASMKTVLFRKKLRDKNSLKNIIITGSKRCQKEKITLQNRSSRL
jgi:hypothetical protein